MISRYDTHIVRKCIAIRYNFSESLQLYDQLIFLTDLFDLILYVPSTIFQLYRDGCLVGFVALRPKLTAMVIAGRSVHLTTLFPGQACTSG